MHIRMVQHHAINPSDFIIDRPDGMEEYVAVLAHSPAWFRGEGGEDFLLQADDVFLYRQGEPQYFYGSGEPFVHDWCHFSIEPGEEETLAALGIPFGRPGRAASSVYLSDLMRLMVLSQSGGWSHRETIGERHLWTFFEALSDLLRPQPPGGGGERHAGELQALRRELYGFPHRSWSSTQTAKAAHMSLSHFQHTYRRLFGCSFQEDIVQSRVRYARELLTRTDFTVAQVASLCGYASELHFMRQFKSRTGFTPTGYRKMHYGMP